MASGSPKSLYLVDAHSLIFQVFHALPEMSSPSGLPTNALFGFTKDMVFLRTERKPDYLICAFDIAGPTFRDKMYAEYKAHRAPMPDDLQLQIPLIYQMLEAMRIPVLGVEGYEADDVIATLACAGAEEGHDVFICSSDKDCRQLIGNRIKIYNLRKREVFDCDSLLKDWGIKPEQVIDLQAMVGDSVDNVPGIPGVGLKTAASLLQKYGTLDEVFAHVGEISGAKRQENLRAAAATIQLSRDLVRLNCQTPLTVDWEAWRARDWDAPRLLGLCREWGFNRLADEVKEWSRARGLPLQATPAVPAPKTPATVQGNLFGTAEANGETAALCADAEAALADAPSPRARWHGDYRLVDTPEKFEAFFKELSQQKRIALDLETTELEQLRSEIVGYAFCWKEGQAWYLPVRGPEGAAVLNAEETLARLKPLLEAEVPVKVNQNIKYDLLVFRRYGVHLGGVAGDSMVADYLLHAGERSHNMEVLADKHLDHQVIPITDLIGKGKKQLCMDQVPTARIAEYACEDADVAWRLCDRLEPQLAAHGLAKLYDDLEIPLIDVLADMEFAGVRLDLPGLHRLGEEMTRQLATLETEIYRIAGREFNIASVKQLRQVMFEELNYPVRGRTGIKGDASTDQTSLEKLALEGYELPRTLVEHRKIAKLKGTYVDALPALVNPRTGRLHTSFNQTVAATGRLSSSDPNLQNIPIRTEQGGQIRQAFLPEEGWRLLTADYSQIELRLLAHFCGDPELRRAFAEDRDIHASVAAQIFGVAESDVNAAMRRVAKMVNFGVIYGISPFGLAARLEMSKEEATRFIEAYFARYPLVQTYQDRLLQNCRKHGYVSTILGRRRAINGIRPDTTYKQRNQPEREAINMQIQGSAADLIKIAMLAIHGRLRRSKLRSRMLLQIHDELVFEAPPEELDTVAEIVNHEMTNALSDRLEVPLKVDLAAGPNWLDVSDLAAHQFALGS
jgi:DNA polymerase-1